MWAADACSHPSTRTNFREILSKDPTGLARREVDRGLTLPIAVSFVEAAQIVSPLTLKTRVRNEDPNWGPLNNLAYDIVMIKEVDPRTHEIRRLRYIESTVSDGRVIAKNGILLSLGKSTFWEYRCHNEISELESYSRSLD